MKEWNARDEGGECRWKMEGKKNVWDSKAMMWGGNFWDSKVTKWMDENELRWRMGKMMQRIRGDRMCWNGIIGDLKAIEGSIWCGVMSSNYSSLRFKGYIMQWVD